MYLEYTIESFVTNTVTMITMVHQMQMIIVLGIVELSKTARPRSTNAGPGYHKFPQFC